MRILIVDDSRAMRMIVRRTLRQAGLGDHDVQEASDGLEAAEVVRQWQPDLVLSDWNMPEMNGIDLLRTLRNEGCGVRFGFVTSEGTDSMRQTASDEGAEFLITKPFDGETFERIIGSVV